MLTCGKWTRSWYQGYMHIDAPCFLWTGIIYFFSWSSCSITHLSFTSPVDISGWTMSGVLVLNQGWPPAQDILIFSSSVTVIKMWQLTAALVSSSSMHPLLCYLTGTGCRHLLQCYYNPSSIHKLTGRPMCRSMTNLYWLTGQLITTMQWQCGRHLEGLKW